MMKFDILFIRLQGLYSNKVNMQFYTKKYYLSKQVQNMINNKKTTKTRLLR